MLWFKLNVAIFEWLMSESTSQDRTQNLGINVVLLKSILRENKKPPLTSSLLIVSYTKSLTTTHTDFSVVMYLSFCFNLSFTWLTQYLITSFSVYISDNYTSDEIDGHGIKIYSH